MYSAPQNNGASERQYLDMIAHILDHGVVRPDRTGEGTRAIHGATLRFDLGGGVVPLLTTKFVSWEKPIKELIWFLSGDTSIRPLLRQGVRIWSDWPLDRYIKATGNKISKKQFEARVLNDDEFCRQWGDIGPGYGKQWRRWEGPDGKVYDQISTLVEMIKTNPSSRRLLFHGWNVADLDQMALPPCHLLYQYFVADGKLSCTLYQRSVDCGLGLPWNLFEAALLVHMLAQQCDLEPGELFWVGHDVHVYLNHEEGLREQIKRTPSSFPTVEITRRPDNLFGYDWTDFQIHGYNPQEKIHLPVAV